MFERPMLLLETGADETMGGGGESAESEAVDFSSFSDDTMIRVPDQDEPVSWKDYQAGYVPLDKYTKGRQEFAEERKKSEADYQQKENFLREQWQQINRMQEGMQQTAQAQNAQQASNPFDQAMGRLVQKGWASGEDLRDLFEAAHNGVNDNLQPIQQQLAEQRELTSLIWQHFQKMQDQVGTLGQERSQKSMQDLFAPMLKEYPWVSEEELKDMYLSYEGDDLNDKFPDMVRDRFSGLSKRFQDFLKSQRDEAKTRGIPTEGGRTAPSLKIKKNLSPSQYAKEAFASFQSRDEGN